MASLTGKKPKNTYKDLLQVSNSNAGIDGTLRFVSDGEGTDSTLKLSTASISTTSKIVVGGDTAASDAAAIGYTSAEGLIITGQGSTSDITVKNDADAAVLTVATGTTNVDIVGDVTAATVNADGDTAASDNAAMGYTSAEGLILTGQGSTNDITIKNDADADVITVATGGTNVDIVGDVTAATVNADGDTSASDSAAMGYTSAEGLILTGQGSTNDITLKNDADGEVFGVPTGTTGVTFKGVIRTDDATDSTSGTSGSIQTDGGIGAVKEIVTDATLQPLGDTAASDKAAVGYTSAEGLILTGQGSTNDVTIKNDADGDVISIPTGTTNVTIAGDLTISGDDLTMGTNTSGAALIADGTNYNPVVISGDVSIGTDGAATIADNAVSLAKMAGLARGKLIYGDSSGDPAALAIGSNTYVLTSDGTDFSWAAASSSAVTSYTNSTDNRVITSVDSSTINGEANLTFDGSVLAVTGNVTATGTVEPAGATAADDNAAIGYTSANGIVITGQGSTNDVTIKNDADADVIKIPTGTTNVTIVGNLTTATGGIATASLADNAVTLAKMAGLARGKIIYGDSSGDPAALAVGSANYVLTSDGTDISWAAASSGPSQATQSALESETNEDTYAAPDLIKYSPGVAKSWIEFEQDGTHSILASYNITSVTDGGSSGDSDIVIATDFSSANYAITGTAGRGVAGDTPRTIGPGVANPAAGTLTITCSDDGGSRVDCEFVSLALFGDQA
jgi:hypothetical protein